MYGSTTTGTLEFRSIIESVRSSGFRDSKDFHLAEATHVDLAKKLVRCKSVLLPSNVYDLEYDKLGI